MKEKERKRKERSKQVCIFYTAFTTKTSCEVFKNNNSAKSDSGTTAESALISPFQKAAFSESIFNVVSVILR